MNKDQMTISQLLEENLEQARLLGMSAEREAALQAKIDQIQQIKSASGIEAMVCLDIMVRQEQGIKKYGTTVAENPLSLNEWLQHAYEECLDQAIYLKRAIQENEKAVKDTARLCAEIADKAEPYKAADLIRKHFGEPVAYTGNGTAGREADVRPTGFFFQMPPQRQPLTDEQLLAAYETEQQGRWGDHVRGLRAVEEAAHGIGKGEA